MVARVERLLRHLEHGLKCRLGHPIAVEEEGMVGAFPGPLVEPSLAVVEVPETDAGDVVRVIGEDLEQLAYCSAWDFRTSVGACVPG